MPGIFLLFIIIAAVVIVVAVSQARRTDEAWSSVAQQLGLNFTPGALFRSRVMEGRLQGLAVRVDTFQRGSGKSSNTYTRFRIRYPRQLGLGLRLTKDSFFSGIGKFFGGQDIELGDAQFDADVIVKATDPEAVRRFLTPPRRLRIHRLLMAHPGVVIDDERVQWEKRGAIRDPDQLASAIRRLVRVAWHLTGDREEDAVVDRAMKAQHEGRIEEALAMLGQRVDSRAAPADAKPPRATDSPAATAALESVPDALLPSTARAAVPESPEDQPTAPQSHEERVLAGELLYLAGRHAEAKEVFEDALKEAPNDQEVRQWAEQSGRQATASDSAPVSPPPASTVPLDAQSVCNAMFSPSNSSLDASRLFEDQYEGRIVSWSGKLRSVEPFTYDYVFGWSPATKAMLEVCEVESSLYGEKTVLAVVQLPREVAEPLKAKIDATIQVEGQLLRVDGFMRNVYLANGKWVAS
jgi:tetratricopeptide (TPR) repeat protein